MGIVYRVLGVSKSGYYAWRGRPISRRARNDADLTKRIHTIHSQNCGVYGAPRIHADLLLEHGIHCSRKRVARLMRRAGLQGISRRRTVGTTKRDPSRPPAPDLVKRRFVATAPNRLWLADITQHPTCEGWLYLASITDLFSRRVVGWSMSDSLRADLVLQALNMAVALRRPGQGLIHHSDHGSQYTSLVYGQRLEAAGVLGSMGTVGDALDNAPQESFHASCRPKFSTARRGAPARSSRPPSSTTSRSSITAVAATPSSDTSAPPSSRGGGKPALPKLSPSHHSQPPSVHKIGATPRRGWTVIGCKRRSCSP